MNFRILLFLLLLSFLCSCGVKGDPSIPKQASVPSVLQNYDDVELNTPLDEAKIR